MGPVLHPATQYQEYALPGIVTCTVPSYKYDNPWTKEEYMDRRAEGRVVDQGSRYGSCSAPCHKMLRVCASR